MDAKRDNFFFNVKLNKWFFFGAPYEEMTGLQEAYILSMSDKDIMEQVANDLLSLPGKPFLCLKDSKFYKNLFTIRDVVFFAELKTGKLVRCKVRDISDFVYTD